jgi:hypothetical protein
MILLLENPPTFYVVALAVMSLLFMLVALGNRVIGLLRNFRRYRDGN